MVLLVKSMGGPGSGPMVLLVKSMGGRISGPASTAPVDMNYDNNRDHRDIARHSHF